MASFSSQGVQSMFCVVDEPGYCGMTASPARLSAKDLTRVRNIAKAVGTTYSVQAGSSQHTPSHCTSVVPVAMINALHVFGSNRDVAFRDCTLACIAAAAACFFCWVQCALPVLQRRCPERWRSASQHCGSSSTTGHSRYQTLFIRDRY